MENEVVVTGVGMVTPLGATADETVAAWEAGEEARREPIEALSGVGVTGAEGFVLPRFDASERLGRDRRMIKFMSDAAVIGCVAAREAMNEAKSRERFAPERIGLFAGTGLAGARVREAIPMVEASIDDEGTFSYGLLGERGLAATNPLLSFKILANMPPCLVSLLEGIKGANLIFGPWEGQTGAALVEAWRAVAEGEVDCAVAGAADFASHPATYVYLHHAGLLHGDGVPAPGAAYVILERRESAERDGRKIHGRIAEVKVTTSADTVSDPLVSRLGRTFAAAPAILLGLAIRLGWPEARCVGADGQAFHARLEAVR